MSSMIPYCFLRSAEEISDSKVKANLVYSRLDSLRPEHKRMLSVEEIVYGVSMASPSVRAERAMENQFWAEVGQGIA